MSEHPLLVQITCHDLGCHLGIYGKTTVNTPELDALGNGGVVFTRAFATAPQCSPARTSLSTGHYPHEVGMLGLAHPPFDFRLQTGTTTAPRHFAAHGYDTHLFGLQHIAASPSDAGFGTSHTKAGTVALGADVADAVEKFLTGNLPDMPLYLEINIEEPHRPYDQGGAMPDQSRGVMVPAYLPQGEPSRREMAALQGAIRNADAAVGRILRAIERSARGRDAIICFAADHGIAMPRAKCTLYDPGLEIALMVRGRGVPAGQRVKDIVSGIDVIPTLCELAGIPAPRDIPGRSTVPLFEGEPGRSLIFAEQTFHSYFDPTRAVRSDNRKLIVNFGVGFHTQIPGDIAESEIVSSDPGRYGGPHPLFEYYDLSTDPWEQNNLAEDPRYAREIDGIRRELLRWMAETNDILLTAGPMAPPQHHRALAFLRGHELGGQDGIGPDAG